MVSVLTPTRQRAEMWFKNLVQCHKLSKTDPEFLVYIDNDDPQLKQYQDYLPQLKHIDVKCFIGEPKRSAPAMKYLAQQASRDYMIFGTDDLNWKTEGWDEKLIAKMPEHGLSVVYPASIPNHQIKARIPFFTKRWRDFTGLWPDIFVHFGPDGWIVKVAENAGTEIFAYDVEILHSKISDETSSRARKNGTGEWKNIVNKRIEDIRKLAEKIKAEIND